MKKYAIIPALLCLVLCLQSSAQGASQPDYREKTQTLSQQIHGQLDELREQSEVLRTQLATAESDLKLSQGQVRELQAELTALNSSLRNTNQRLSDYSEKLTVLKHSLSRWRLMALIELAVIVAAVFLWLNKKLKWVKFIL